MPQRAGVVCALLTGLVALIVQPAGGVHHIGDFVHASRRSQFLRKRTAWHDLIEHHCPRFGRSRVVALPIPKPGQDTQEVTDYRLQLSFDGDRVLTPWLTVLGRHVEGMPLVDVQLRRAGDELKGVRAKVLPLPDELLVRHAALFNDFKNASHWPKHVLLHYRWHNEGELDFVSGLYVVMAAGLAVFLLLSFNTLAGVQGKLAQFLSDVVGDAADPLLPPGPGRTSLGGGAAGLPPPYLGKRGSHVE